MDGNLAALNEHLARQEAKDYEHEWKEDYIDDCVNAAMYQLKTEGSFMHDGLNYKPLDIFCGCEEDIQNAANAALLNLMFSPLESQKSLTNLPEWITYELETWVDADYAYEQHVKENEPQEP